MAIHVLRRVAELGDDLILAPERFDPRRDVGAGADDGTLLSEHAELLTENVSESSFASDARVLVLDTGHAYDGFVIHRHAAVAPSELGSTKRRLQPGDVIISRLRPYLRQVAYLDPALFELQPGGNHVVASTEFFVLRGRAGFDVACLVPFLLSPRVQAALAAGQEGGHHPRFSKELLGSLVLPASVLAAQAQTAASVRALAAAVRGALAGVQTLVAESEAGFGTMAADDE